MTFKEQSEIWFEGLRVRRRDPTKASTLATYRSYLNRWILPNIGDLEIEHFANSRLKSFVSVLADARKPGEDDAVVPTLGAKSIQEITSVVKQIVGSVMNDEGIQVYARIWNNDYADLPRVDPSKQKAPCATRGQVERAIRDSNSMYAAFYVLLASTGLRIGEARAVRCGDDSLHTCWVPEHKLILVRTAFWRGTEQSTKTVAGAREVDLPERANEYLMEYCSSRADGLDPAGNLMFRNETGVGPMHQSTIQKSSLDKTDLPGFHSLRRFRTTHLRSYGVPEEIIKFWLGHSSSDITDRYSKLAQNVEERRKWVDRAGSGFEIPKRRDNDGRLILRTVRETLSPTMCDVQSTDKDDSNGLSA